MPRFIDRTGLRYGRLTPLRWARDGRRIRWLCRCDCGTECWVESTQIGGRTNSCGCLQAERASKANSTHGFARPGRVSPTYHVWQAAKRRCYSPADRRYASYGGRGIRVCERWVRSFENFLADMGERPDGMSLDRIDVDGDYAPNNCRWATAKEQADNRRTTIWVEHNSERMPLKDFAKAIGANYKALWYKVQRKGMTPHEAAASL